MPEIKTINGTRLLVVKNYDEMSRLGAQMILERIKGNRKINLLLPTGTTPEGVYKILRKQGPKYFNRVTFFNKDEYCEKVGNTYKLVSEKNSKGFRYYMRKHFFQKIKPRRFYFPSMDNYKKPGSCDTFIKKNGGLDLALSAMGEDGHLGFNFPGTKFNSVTRLVKLNGNIKKVNKKLTGFDTPEYGITIGLKTEMLSKEIIFLVSGKRKAKILAKILKAKKPTVKIPATILKKHKNCHWIVDREALSVTKRTR